MSAVLQFPAKVQRQAKRRVDRRELEARHSWVMANRGKWGNEATDGVRLSDSPMQIFLKAALRKELGLPELTAEKMRRDIAEGRKLIEKRNRVKAWLASLGADLEGITAPEQALFFVFDRLHGSEQPASA